MAASIHSSSFAEASEQLQSLGDISLGEKRLARIAQRVGNERVAQRQQRLAAYQAQPIPQQKIVPPGAPQGLWQNRVAVVYLDGGRVQLRDERWGQPRAAGEKKPNWWREPKVAMLATMMSSEQAADPLPAVPECLLNPLWLVPKLNEIKAAQGGAAAAEQARGSRSEEDVEPGHGKLAGPQNWSPPHVVRTVVGTLEPYDHLGQLAKVEAYHRGFTAATRKAFVADGLPHNWTVQQKYFGDYTPIADLMHALSYVYQAAKASTLEMEECWCCCTAWITLVWQGKIDELIEQIDQQLAAAHDPAAGEELQASRRYLANNQERMRYAEYRRLGLPITTAQMESTIKRINRRMKGTEKFWRPAAEPLLQLCADDLSETKPLTKYWRDRRQTRTGRRKSRTTR